MAIATRAAGWPCCERGAGTGAPRRCPSTPTPRRSPSSESASPVSTTAGWSPWRRRAGPDRIVVGACARSTARPRAALSHVRVEAAPRGPDRRLRLRSGAPDRPAETVLPLVRPARRRRRDVAGPDLLASDRRRGAARALSLEGRADRPHPDREAPATPRHAGARGGPPVSPSTSRPRRPRARAVARSVSAATWRRTRSSGGERTSRRRVAGRLRARPPPRTDGWRPARSRCVPRSAARPAPRG